MRKSVFWAIAVVGALAVGGSLAAAHTNNIPVTINISGAEPNFSDVERYTGQILAAKPACERGRKVTLHRQEPGGAVKVAEATSTQAGTFKVGTPGAELASGTYFTKVKRETLRNDGPHRHVCLPDKSNNVVHSSST